MTKDQFIEQVFELAFGHDAINRDFEYSEVIEQLEEFNEHALLWESVSDKDKEQENELQGLVKLLEAHS
jgi:hypothetical protein